ncbi:MAG: HAD family hydrolase [Promethearchaeota archaeon]
MKKKVKPILSFDLDYTLINNRKGIVNSFNYALKKFNLPELNNSIIEKMIGLPLNNMFAKFTDINPSKLSFTFREYYITRGIYQSKLLPGVKKKLRELKSNNYSMGIITSKKQNIAIKIVEYLRIEGFFDYILGETDQIKNKLDPNLARLLLEKYPEGDFIIIGDHPKDALLAKSLSCPFIGVLTGFHTAKQLKDSRGNEESTLILRGIRKLSIDMIESFNYDIDLKKYRLDNKR